MWRSKIKMWTHNCFCFHWNLFVESSVIQSIIRIVSIEITSLLLLHHLFTICLRDCLFVARFLRLSRCPTAWLLNHFVCLWWLVTGRLFVILRPIYLLDLSSFLSIDEYRHFFCNQSGQGCCWADKVCQSTWGLTLLLSSNLPLKYLIHELCRLKLLYFHHFLSWEMFNKGSSIQALNWEPRIAILRRKGLSQVKLKTFRMVIYSDEFCFQELSLLQCWPPWVCITRYLVTRKEERYVVCE